MSSFATLFDNNYLSRGIALYKSLYISTAGKSELFVLALDEIVYSHFQRRNYENIKLIHISEIEDFFPELIIAKGNRSIIEYYFTLSPFLPLFILNKFGVERITTLDADILFFSNPDKIFSSYPHASVLITPHNFSYYAQHWIGLGTYNVSFQSFKNDERAMAVLNDWKNKCFEWCYDKYDEQNKRYADQLYLDKWITAFEGVKAIEIPGTGVAPWNVSKFNISTGRNNEILIDGNKLIYYHFQHFRVYNRFLSFHGLPDYDADPKQSGLKEIYNIYLQSLKGLSKNKDTGTKRIVLNKPFIKLLSRNDIFLSLPFAIIPVNPYKYYIKIKKWLKL